MIRKFLCAAALFSCSFYSSTGQLHKGRVVFSSRANDTSNSELYIINSDGTGEKKLTLLNQKDKDLPSVFRDRIVYQQGDKKGSGTRLMITGTGGGQPKPILENKSVYYPRWSHDGKLIAYDYRSEKGKDEIWVADSNGKNDRKLISNARHPCWSYQNDIMLFTRDYEIWSFDLKKGTERRLNHSKDTVSVFPSISPDGKQFAYQGEFGGTFGICVADIKTGKVQKFIPLCGDISSWTDDPKYIISGCLTGTDHSTQISMIDVTTAAKIPVTNNSRSNYFPCWASYAE